MLSNLNIQQKEAVQIINGPIMIVAGPGSGKTRVLVSRIIYLISQGINPKNILAVTFTNKAAQEMKERIEKFFQQNDTNLQNDTTPQNDTNQNDTNLQNVTSQNVTNLQNVTKQNDTSQNVTNLQNVTKQNVTTQNVTNSSGANGANKPTIGTFHSFCLRILRREAKQINLDSNFIIYDEGDSLSLIKKIFKEHQISEDYLKPRQILSAISRAKNELITPIEYQKMANSYLQEKTAEIFIAYQEELLKLKALDFDDLINWTVTLFQNQPEILKKYQNWFQYLLIDEWQDTNRAQYVLVKLLAGDKQNIFVIGDLDQSIYGWRGADFRNVLEFEKDFPRTKIILLEQNYRSTQIILEAAQSIIEENNQRKEKILWTNKKGGDLIIFHQAIDEKGEGSFIVDEINRLLKQGYSYQDIVVLYRINAQSRAIEESFLKKGVPYRVIGTTKFYHRQEIKDILAYLRLLINPDDELSLSRIINVPPRKIGRRTLEKIKNQDISSSNLAPVKNFFDLIESLRQQTEKIPLTNLIKEVIDRTNYNHYLINSSDHGEEKIENIHELLTVAKKYNHLPSSEGIGLFLEEVALLSDQDEIDQKHQVVNLMTLHCAKGLEFPIVFIAGFEESILPHGRSAFSPPEMEEERRLCYVGITRAKEKLYLTCARLRHLFGGISANPPSRFLSNIPNKLIKKTT